LPSPRGLVRDVDRDVFAAGALHGAADAAEGVEVLVEGGDADLDESRFW
jgi:hypothetical protein